MGPLRGVRVLDLSRLLPGPACTWYLQGLGARVDRVESAGKGDFTRHIPPFVDGCGVYFAAVSRGKRSLGVDLRAAGAGALIRRLLPHYQVLVEGFKPGVMEAIGLAPDQLVDEFPGLVVARLTGFGQTGPWQDRPGHDLNYLGLTGAMAAAQRSPAGLAIPPVQIADLTGALVAAMGIAAGLYGALATGRGRVLDVSLTEAALSTFAPHLTGFTAEGRSPKPGGEVLTGGMPVYGTYLCADDRWLTVGAVEPKFQAELASHLGRIDRPSLERAFRQRPRDEWVDLLERACVGPVLDVHELVDHPQLRDRGAVQRLASTTWVRPPLSDLEATAGTVPGLGEHTDAVLGDAGITGEEIAAMRDSGLVA